MSARGQVESHDAVMRSQKARVDREIGRGSTVGLNIDAPFLRVETVRLERALLAQSLDFVYNFTTAVVAAVEEDARQW